MGKRSSFERRPQDAYDTPAEAVDPLLSFLRKVKTFAEPCVGNGLLRQHLEIAGLRCTFAGDIRFGQDALFLNAGELGDADAIITNPPWTAELLHPLLNRFMWLAPTWLLLSADWAHNRHAVPYLRHCSHFVSVGRVKWIAGSDHSGKDNVAWFRFDRRHVGRGPQFFGREGMREAAE